MVNIREILESANTTGAPVSADMLPVIYDELRHLAAGYMSRQPSGQTLQPTALVHEAWLRLSKEDAYRWNDRAHFFRAAAQAMRCILVDRARAKAGPKRGANAEKLDIQVLDIAAATVDDRILLIDEALHALEKENPESARVISLMFFGGLTEKEIVAMEGIAERTVRRRWAYGKTRLLQLVRQTMKQ